MELPPFTRVVSTLNLPHVVAVVHHSIVAYWPIVLVLGLGQVALLFVLWAVLRRQRQDRVCANALMVEQSLRLQGHAEAVDRLCAGVCQRLDNARDELVRQLESVRQSSERYLQEAQRELQVLKSLLLEATTAIRTDLMGDLDSVRQGSERYLESARAELATMDMQMLGMLKALEEHGGQVQQIHKRLSEHGSQLQYMRAGGSHVTG